MKKFFFLSSETTKNGVKKINVQINNAKPFSNTNHVKSSDLMAVIKPIKFVITFAIKCLGCKML
jgi:hypothetical protein